MVGIYVHDSGQSTPPIALWSLLAVAAFAWARAHASEPAPAAPTDDAPTNEPWWQRATRFDRERWNRLAWLNLAGAVGVTLGYFA